MLLQKLKMVEGTIAVYYLLCLILIVYSSFLAMSSRVWLCALLTPSLHWTPTCLILRVYIVATEIYSQFVSSPIYYIILFHFLCLGACFRVLSANKFKAQKQLTELKHELGLKGKETLSRDNQEQWKKLKDAEVNGCYYKKEVVRVL